jgi:hypothetical protein
MTWLPSVGKQGQVLLAAYRKVSRRREIDLGVFVLQMGIASQMKTVTFARIQSRRDEVVLLQVTSGI